jgi:hypothetical protein
VTGGPGEAFATTLPRYGSGSLAELLPSAVAAVGGPGWDNVLGLPPMDSCVVFLVDGLGDRLLRAHADEAPYLAGLVAGTLTSGVPSTTATSLTSLGTGLPPGAHGVVGFTSRIPGTDRLLEALRWDKNIDPRVWQSHDTAFARARESGIEATVVSKRMFQGTGLTEASQRGAVYVGADTVGERISGAVRSATESRSITYLYEGELDATGHRRGCGSWAWKHQLAMIDSFAARLREALPERTGLIVTGDHGMVDVDENHRIDVDEEPELMRGVSLFGGEARFRHLYCDNGAVDDVAARWAERLGDDGIVLTRDQAIDEGWFGEVASEVRLRLGDVMVASIGDRAVVSTSRFPYEATLVGLHGSLTDEEMLVPLLVDLSA